MTTCPGSAFGACPQPTPCPAGRQRCQPLDRWTVAGTPTTEAYPCWCNGTGGCRQRCPCRGRADAADMPAHCCARRQLETKQRRESGE